jgi:hypothetical protein
VAEWSYARRNVTHSVFGPTGDFSDLAGRTETTFAFAGEPVVALARAATVRAPKMTEMSITEQSTALFMVPL